jgi:imidazolonepropionase-like amidohydrolase
LWVVNKATINPRALASAVKIPVLDASKRSTKSAGMLQEMSYAARRHPYFTPDKLIAMATTNPAKMVRIDEYIGSLTVGRMADFIVVRADPSAPAQAVLKPTPADIALVVIAGAPSMGTR